MLLDRGICATFSGNMFTKIHGELNSRNFEICSASYEMKQGTKRGFTCLLEAKMFTTKLAERKLLSTREEARKASERGIILMDLLAL